MKNTNALSPENFRKGPLAGLDEVAFAAHKFVEGQLSYDNFVKAVKNYADACDVPLTSNLQIAPNRTSGETVVEKKLESALERHLVTLRKALAKQNNNKKIAELCTQLQRMYLNINQKREIHAKETERSKIRRGKIEA